jgi:hypothetical protein
VRRVLHAGIDEFRAQSDHMPPPALTEPPDLSNDALWRMRRDLEGCKPTEPAQLRDPPDDPLVGLMLLRLRFRGATPDGSYWNLNGGLRWRVGPA